MKKNLLNLIGLAVVIAGVAMGWQWIWGVLFLLWTIPSLRMGEVHLITPVSRKESPVLFWTIGIIWIGLSVYLIVADAFTLLSHLS